MDILLVEDNSSDASLLREMFTVINEEIPDIHWVTDGACALDYVLQRKEYQYADRPDFILLDLNLPRLDGIEVLRQLKSTQTLSGIPVVVLTTSTDPREHSQCKSLGADMCLSKPSAIKDYEDMVRRVMSWARLRLNQPPPISYN